MPYVRKEEVVVYVSKIDEMLDSLYENPRSDYVHYDFCAYNYPYDRLWFVCTRYVWSRDFYFECRARIRKNAHFVGCHNVEVFGVTTAVRGDVFMLVPDCCKSGLEPSYLMNVPSPCAILYFSNRILGETTERSRNVWGDARSEHAVLVAMSFPAACR